MIILINVWFLRSPGVSLFVYRITPYIFPYTYYPLSLLLRMLDVKFTGLYFILGILIAGGVTNGDTRLKSAELFNPNSGVICPVADLPEVTWSFTSCNGLQCGNADQSQSRYVKMIDCAYIVSPRKIKPFFFNRTLFVCRSRLCTRFEPNGTFSPTAVRLIHQRAAHICWPQPSGEVLLMGGFFSKTTTEMVAADGSSSTADFNLAHDTEWVKGNKVLNPIALVANSLFGIVWNL